MLNDDYMFISSYLHSGTCEGVTFDITSSPNLCGLWIVDCGLWIVDCGLWIVDRGLWIVDCGSWIVDCGSWI